MCDFYKSVCEPASGAAAAAAVGPLLLGRAEDGIGTWRAEQQSKYLAVESSRELQRTLSG